MRSPDSLRNRLDLTPVFRREGDYWTIAYDAEVVRLRDARGLRYLEPLLRHPGRFFHVCDLIRVAGCTDAGQRALDDGTAEVVERARKAVTNRIRQTLARIANDHQVLGLHLRNAVHTGTRCVYTPERPTQWSAGSGRVASLHRLSRPTGHREARNTDRTDELKPGLNSTVRRRRS